MKHPVRGVTIVVAAIAVAGCANDGPLPVAEGPAVTGQPDVPTATVDDTSPSVETTTGQATDDTGPPGQTVTVQAIDNTFRPDRIEIAPGTEVVWVNRGRNDHDLMTNLGFGVTAADFGPGEEYRHVFTEPGEYPYYCTIHGTPDIGMTGTVVVTDTA